MSLKWFGCLIVLSILDSGSLWARAEASAGHTLYLVESHQLPLCEEDQTGDTIPQRRRVHDHAGELTHATQQHFHCHLFLCHTKQFYAEHIYILCVHVNTFYSNIPGQSVSPSGSHALCTSTHLLPRSTTSGWILTLPARSLTTLATESKTFPRSCSTFSCTLLFASVSLSVSGETLVKTSAGRLGKCFFKVSLKDLSCRCIP